jgi:transcriptional regulator with XRE-family HTH domain
MQSHELDPARAARLREAIKARGHRKMMALAAELDISSAALSKWTQGHAMSVEHACRLSDLLDVSLDWLLMGRNGPEWQREEGLNRIEAQLIDSLRHRPERIANLLAAIVAEIPRSSDQ